MNERRGQPTQKGVCMGTNRRYSSRVITAAIWTVFSIAAFFLLTPHQAHVFDLLPWVFLLACPLMHLLMHRGHNRHGAGRDQDDSTASHIGHRQLR